MQNHHRNFLCQSKDRKAAASKGCFMVAATQRQRAPNQPEESPLEHRDAVTPANQMAP